MALDVNLREGDAAPHLLIHGRREHIKSVLIIAGGDAAEGVARRFTIEELAGLRGTPSTRTNNKDVPGPCPSAG